MPEVTGSSPGVGEDSVFLIALPMYHFRDGIGYSATENMVAETSVSRFSRKYIPKLFNRTNGLGAQGKHPGKGRHPQGQAPFVRWTGQAPDGQAPREGQAP